MKKHLCNLWFDTSSSVYSFTGYIHGTIIDPAILFKKVFGFELPAHTTITII